MPVLVLFARLDASASNWWKIFWLSFFYVMVYYCPVYYDLILPCWLLSPPPVPSLCDFLGDRYFENSPFGIPFSSFNTTAALSSNFILVPSILRYSFLCLTITAGTTVFLISSFPFFTEAITKSPTPAEATLPLTVFLPLRKIS